MYTGKEPYIFWFGVVEDRLDPLELGRVRVRILGFHPELRKDFPTEKLPWAQVIQQPQSGSISGKGLTPIGLLDGSWVVGFFVDGPTAQVPIVMGSIYGMNETVKEDENFGDGFRDVREDLEPFPVDEFKKQDYPDGKTKNGDKHGAQLENIKPSKKYPRDKYAPESSGRPRGTPDLNILSINDPVRIGQTIIKTKRESRGKGLRDHPVPVADNKHPTFKCGVINNSGVSKPTIKALGGPAPQESSSFSSRAKNYKQFKDKPTNNNNIRIDSAKTMGLKTKQAQNTNNMINLNANVPTIPTTGLA